MPSKKKRSYKLKQRMEKTVTAAFDEIEHHVLNMRLSERKEDDVTLEQKLKALLVENRYTLDEHKNGGQKNKSGLYRWDNLKSMFQATDEELNSALRLVSAVEINGYWRIVDDLCIGDVLCDLVLKAGSDNSSFDGNEVVKSLEETLRISPDLAHHVLELYAITTDGKVYKWDTKRVYVELARYIIGEDKLDIDTFVLCLRDLQMPLNLEMLDGEILVKKDLDRFLVFLPSDRNKPPKGNTVTSVSQAFFTQNQNRSLKRDDRTMEQKLKSLFADDIVVRDVDESDLYNWKDLKRLLNATDEELKSALSLVSAVEIDGYWRIIDDWSIDIVLSKLVDEAYSNDWCLSSLDGNEVVKSLEAFHPVVTRHVLEKYATTTDGGRVWELDTKRVCVDLGLGLFLKTCGQRIGIQYFMDKWTCVRLPVSLDMLEGKILVEIDGDNAYVHLPSDHNNNNSNLTSVSQAFPPDSQNLSRFYKPRIEKIDLLETVNELRYEGDDAVFLEQRLKAHLVQNPYTLDEDKEFGGQKMKNKSQWDDLKSMFHATDEELKSALRVVSAVEINGNWRVVTDMCIGQVLYNLVWLADTKDWCFSALDGNEVVKSLRDTWGFSTVLTLHCLERFATTTDGRVWKLDTKRVCVQLARWVIKSNGNTRMKFEKFNHQWSCIGLPLSLDMLEVEIFVEEDGSQSWVCLPRDPSVPPADATQVD